MVRKIRHRGPDWSGSYSDAHCILMHERLSIVDDEHGAQPLYDTKTKRVLAINGEIYNHKELEKKLSNPHDFQTNSDCEVLLYLYDEFGVDFLNEIDGIFAFSLYDPNTKDYFIARDHIGIIPLYIGWDENGVTYVASEMKSIESYCEKLQEFPPGNYYKNGEFTQWYQPNWVNEIPTDAVSLPKLKKPWKILCINSSCAMCPMEYSFQADWIHQSLLQLRRNTAKNGWNPVMLKKPGGLAYIPLPLDWMVLQI